MFMKNFVLSLLLSTAAMACAQSSTQIDPGRINWGMNPTATDAALGSMNGVSLTNTSPQAMYGPLSSPSLTATKTLNGLDPTQFVQVPRQNLLSWFIAADDAQALGQDVIIYGDSLSKCDQVNCSVGPPNDTERWPDIVARQLWAAYGYGGTGAIPLIGSANGPLLDTNVYTMSGTWTTDPRLGPSQSGYSEANSNSVVVMSNAEVLTFTTPLPYDRINVYCMTTSTSGSLAIVIDGVAQGTACATPTSSPTAVKVTSSTVNAGTHASTTLTCAGTCYVYAMEGQNGTTGIRVHNLAVGGATSSWWGANPSTSFVFSDLINSGFVPLTITNLLTNDAALVTPLSTFIANMTAIYNHRTVPSAYLPSQVAEVAMVPAVDSGPNIPTYTAALLPVANSLGLPIVNVQSRWGLTYNATSPVWSNPTAEGVHPGVIGAADEAAMVLQAITNYLPPAFGQYQLPASPAGYSNANPLNMTSSTNLNPGVNLVSGGVWYGSDLGYVANDLNGATFNMFANRRYAPSSGLITNCFYSGTPTLQSSFTCPFIMSPTAIGAYIPFYAPIIKGNSGSSLTFVPQTAAGTGATVGCSPTTNCSQLSGTVTAHTGTSPAAGMLFYISDGGSNRSLFSNCTWTPVGQPAYELGVYSSGASSNILATLDVNVAPAASTSYQFVYTCGD